MSRCTRILLGLAVFAAGCAAASPIKGQAGPIAWEVVDVVQSWVEQGTRLRWDYVLTLHNTGSGGIYLQDMEIGSQARDLYGGMGTERIERRLEAGETVRLTRWDSLGCPQCPPGDIPVLMSEGFTKFLTIHGLVDGGDSIRVEIRIRLNSSVGRRSAEKTG